MANPVIGVDVSKYEVKIRDDKYTLESIISHWDPDKAVKPIDFVIQRTSYGGKEDEFLDFLYLQCLKIPIRGTYHYYSSGVKWTTQLDTIMRAMDGKVYHFHYIDYEKAYNNLNRTTFAEMMELTKQLRIETKRPTGNYFNLDIYKNFMQPYNADAVINENDLWLSWYPFLPFLNLSKGPTKPKGITKEPEFWQWGAGDVPLVAGYNDGFAYGSWRHGIDLNRWRGTIEELRIYANVDGQEEPPPVEPPIVIDTGGSMYKGVVLIEKVNVRVSPSANSEDVGDLVKSDPVEGDATVIFGGYDWLHLTKPDKYAGAYVAMGPISAPRSYVKITEVTTEPPVPQTIEERIVAIEADIVAIKKKLKMA